jgi:hypothetical protein
MSVKRTPAKSEGDLDIALSEGADASAPKLASKPEQFADDIICRARG